MGIPRDEIISLFARPGRKLNPAAIGEITAGRFGAEIPEAFDHEVHNFIKQRIAETSAPSPYYVPNEFSAVRLFALVGKAFAEQSSLFDDETEIFEYKMIMPEDKKGRMKLAKSLASFYNNKGGYIFIGIDDDRRVVGIDRKNFDSFDWDRFSDEMRRYFTPLVAWDRHVAQMAEKWVGVISAAACDRKPVVCTRTFDGVLEESAIYFRYRGISDRIRSHDLLSVLAERDRSAARAAMADMAAAVGAVSKPPR